MKDLKHPAEAGYFQIYRQASQLARQTSRASNPDWYAAPQELSRQWHLWFDGEFFVSAIYDEPSNTWHEGPGLPEFAAPEPGQTITTLGPPEAIEELNQTLKEIINDKQYGGKAKSLGFILHLADEFSIADLSTDFGADDDFQGVTELLAVDPPTALADSDVDVLRHSWRALPYWGVSEGERRSVALQVSREWQPIVEEIRRWGEENNIPVQASAYSAPLEALSLVPALLSKAGGEGGKGDLILFQYQPFSVLAALDRDRELVLVRALPHRQGLTHPARLGDTLLSTAQLLMLGQPEVTILSMSPLDPDPLIDDLSEFFELREPMNIGFVDIGEVEALGEIPGGRAEMLLGVKAKVEELEAGSPFLETQTFKALKESWGSQDFYGLSEHEKAIFPTRKELQLFKGFGMVKLILFIAVLGIGGWTGFEYVRAVTTVEWRLSTEDAAEAMARTQAVVTESQEVQYWEKMLATRSNAALNMEFLKSLAPEGKGVYFTDVSYNVEPRPEGTEGTLGFTRVWNIQGYATADARPLLTELGSNSAMRERFNAFAEQFSADNYRVEGDSRSLQVSLSQRARGPGGLTYLTRREIDRLKISFELSIQLGISDEDDLALPARFGKKEDGKRRR